MVFLLELHDSSTYESVTDPIELEIRRRIWWYTFYIEMTAAIHQYPTVQMSMDYDYKIPCPIANSFFNRKDFNPHLSMHSNPFWYFKHQLFEILLFILNFQWFSLDEYMHQFQMTMEGLERWKAEFPMNENQCVESRDSVAISNLGLLFIYHSAYIRIYQYLMLNHHESLGHSGKERFRLTFEVCEISAIAISEMLKVCKLNRLTVPLLLQDSVLNSLLLAGWFFCLELKDSACTKKRDNESHLANIIEYLEMDREFLGICDTFVDLLKKMEKNPHDFQSLMKNANKI